MSDTQNEQDHVQTAVPVVGVDAGGTLIKIAYAVTSGADHQVQAEAPELVRFPFDEIEQAAAWLLDRLNTLGDAASARIGLTGGHASRFRALLPGCITMLDVPEFVASMDGARRMPELQVQRDAAMQQSGGALATEADDGFILAQVGTGTSIYYVSNEGSSADREDEVGVRVGGIGLGGGTILGLTRLLCGLEQIDEIVRLAPTGDRGKVDLTVAQIYAPAEPPIEGDLTAANFARSKLPAAGVQYADYAAAVIGMVAEVVTTVAVQAAQQHGVKRVVYVGATFDHNPLLQELTFRFTEMLGAQAIIPQQGAYCGAIGALETAKRASFRKLF